MKKEEQLLSMFIVISWGIFVFLDFKLTGVVSRALREDWPSYVELYYPLSFFRYSFLLLSIVLTIVALYKLCFNKSEEN